MASLHKRTDSGRKGYRNEPVSSGDELQETTPAKRTHYHERRKSLQLRKAKLRAAQRQQRFRNSNDSDASEDDAEANGDDEADVGSSEGSDDDKVRGSASSGANKSAMKKLRAHQRLLSNGQAGQITPKTVKFQVSPKNLSPRQLLPAFEPKPSEVDMFDRGARDSLTPSPVDQTIIPLSEDEFDNTSDVGTYDTAALDLDDDEESDFDDEIIEKEEEEYLIQHLVDEGELPFEETTLQEMMQNRLKASPSPELDYEAYILPSTEIPPEQAAPDAPIFPAYLFPVDQSSPLQHRGGHLMSPVQDDIHSDMDWKNLETGLRTPNSLPQPLAIDDDTDQEDPKVKTISHARLKRMSGHGFATITATPTGVRKTLKPKTPKRGSWKVSKKDTSISHGNNGELVISKKGKVAHSGTITPRGVVTGAPNSRRVSISSMSLADPFMDASATMPSSIQTSPVVSHFSVDFRNSMSTSNIFHAFSDMPSNFIEPHTEVNLDDFIVSRDDHI